MLFSYILATLGEHLQRVFEATYTQGHQHETDEAVFDDSKDSLFDDADILEYNVCAESVLAQSNKRLLATNDTRGTQ